MARASRAALLLPLSLAACAHAPAALAVEDLPTENLVRIVNSRPRAVRFYYADEPGFDERFQMFGIRYRDGAGRLVAMNGGGPEAWWTPLAYSSNLYVPGRQPSQPLTVPGRGSRDFPRAELLAWLRPRYGDAPRVTGPCTVQFRLFARPHPRSLRYFGILSGWAPGPCPGT